MSAEDLRYTHRRTVNLTPGMAERLHQVVAGRATPGLTEAEFIREALREHLDREGDLIGSRKHFSKSLQKQLSSQEERLLFALYTLMFLVARVGIYLVKLSKKESVEVSPLALVESAMLEVSAARAQLEALHSRLENPEAPPHG